MKTAEAYLFLTQTKTRYSLWKQHTSHYLAFRGDPVDEINKVIEEHPDFILAHLFKAAYLTQVLEARVYDDLANSVSAAEELSANANTRELFHLKAVSAWKNGDISAAVSGVGEGAGSISHEICLRFS